MTGCPEVTTPFPPVSRRPRRGLCRNLDEVRSSGGLSWSPLAGRADPMLGLGVRQARHRAVRVGMGSVLPPNCPDLGIKLQGPAFPERRPPFQGESDLMRPYEKPPLLRYYGANAPWNDTNSATRPLTA